MKIQVIFDNYPDKKSWGWEWGFSALVEGKILFDTGSDPDIFIKNLTRACNPKEITKVIISHFHWDHTGGLFSLVNRNKKIEVFVGEGFSRKFEESLKRKGAKVLRIKGWKRIETNIWIGPELPKPIPERFLVIEGNNASFLIAGCSHPGIENFARLTREKFQKPIWLLGGFHLFSASVEKIKSTAEELKKIGVVKAFPSHCSGERAFEIFSNYFEVARAGSGKIIEF